MNKKIIVFTLIFVLCLGSIAQGVSQEETESANILLALGLITGYEDGSLKLDRQITRAEVTALVIRTIGKEGQVQSSKGKTAFKDVKESHWATGYINIAVKDGLIEGYEDGNFKPDANISNAEVLALLVRLLGYKDSVDMTKPWPLNYITRATELKINDDMVIAADAKALRGKVFNFVDKSLMVKLNIAY